MIKLGFVAFVTFFSIASFAGEDSDSRAFESPAVTFGNCYIGSGCTSSPFGGQTTKSQCFHMGGESWFNFDTSLCEERHQ